MEVNISHRSRQAILSTTDLTHPDLFTDALNELIQLMKMVCVSLLGIYIYIYINHYEVVNPLNWLITQFIHFFVFYTIELGERLLVIHVLPQTQR